MLILGCSNNGLENTEKPKDEKQEITKNDSINMEEFNSMVKRISDPGELIELKSYEIGKLKNIEFIIEKYKFFKSDEDMVALCIQMRYETEYYYRTERVLIFKSEITPLIEAVTTIKDKYLNSNPRETTIVAYITSGKFSINSKFTDKWETNLLVNISNEDARLKISNSDIIELLSLLNKAKDKSDELSKSTK